MSEVKADKLFCLTIFTFLLLVFSFPSASAGGFKQGHVKYVIRIGLSGSIQDAETGNQIDNVVIEGEIHSKKIYFKVEINNDTYSYWLWDDSQHSKILRKGNNISLDDEVFTLPLKGLISEDKHTFEFTVNAQGYRPKILSGEFYLTRQNFVQIELNPSESKIEYENFSLTLESNSAEMVRNWGGTEYRELSVDEYEGSERDDGEPIWSTNSEWISKSKYESSFSHYKLIDERTTDKRVKGYEVPVYTRSVTWEKDRSEPIYDTYWVDGYWTYKTVKEYGWKKTGVLNWLWAKAMGKKTRVEKDYSTVINYTIHYNEFHRDWNWFPSWDVGWGDWYYHKSDSFTVSPSKSSNYWKGKEWGGRLWQDWYKCCTGKKTNYGRNYYIWGVTGTHQEKDEWIPGHEETDYDTIVGYEKKPVYGEWTLDHWKTISKSKGNKYNGTISHNSTTQWRYSEKRTIHGKATEYKIKELEGYRIQSGSGAWSSKSVSTTVNLESNGYLGEVNLSINDSNLPKGASATLASDSLNLVTEATTTLTVNFPTSEKALTGIHPVQITATPEKGETQSTSFGLEVTRFPNYVYKYTPTLVHEKGTSYFPCSPMFDGDYNTSNNKWNYDWGSSDKSVQVFIHRVNESGKAYIQYWYYYAWNNFWVLGDHRNDWELLEVVLNEEGTPIEAKYGEHGGIDSYDWSNVKKVDRTHPVAYAASGSHAMNPPGGLFKWSIWEGSGFETGWKYFIGNQHHTFFGKKLDRGHINGSEVAKMEVQKGIKTEEEWWPANYNEVTAPWQKSIWNNPQEGSY